ncbi:hypothetical protein ACFLVE_03570 [Chloroflexota bacterium]
MVIVTDSGKEELKRIASEVVKEAGSTLRLIANEQGQLGLISATNKDDDQVIEHQGDTILLVDTVLSEALDGICIDCQDEGEGPRLILTTTNTEEEEAVPE